jgi:hypothetical protein
MSLPTLGGFGFPGEGPGQPAMQLSTEAVDKVVGNRWSPTTNPREIKPALSLLNFVARKCFLKSTTYVASTVFVTVP